MVSARPIRRLLLIVMWLGMIGSMTDLALLDHVESWTQWIPLAVLAFAAVALAAAMLTCATAAVGVFQLAMVLTLLTGGLGFVLHFQGNAEFQIEIDPALSGPELWWKCLRAKAPPALAPAAMTQLGLVGFALARLMPTSRTTSRTP